VTAVGGKRVVWRDENGAWNAPLGKGNKKKQTPNLPKKERKHVISQKKTTSQDVDNEMAGEGRIL